VLLANLHIDADLELSNHYKEKLGYCLIGIRFSDANSSLFFVSPGYTTGDGSTINVGVELIYDLDESFIKYSGRRDGNDSANLSLKWQN
jgi:hypothetical protein